MSLYRQVIQASVLASTYGRRTDEKLRRMDKGHVLIVC